MTQVGHWPICPDWVDVDPDSCSVCDQFEAIVLADLREAYGSAPNGVVDVTSTNATM